MVASVLPELETWPTTQACALTGNQTSDPLVCRLALNPLSHTSQDYIYVYTHLILEWEEWGERAGVRERHQFVVLLIYALIGWFLYFLWPGTEPHSPGISGWCSNQLSYRPGLNILVFFFLLFRFYLFILREGEGREKGRGRNIDQLPVAHTLTRDRVATQACALTGNRTGNLLILGTMPN